MIAADPSPPSPEVPETTIRPARGWAAVNLAEVWDFRELLYFLAWRDFKVRYRQTVLGAAWVIIQPLVTMVVFTIVFGRIARISFGDLPYAVVSYAGLVPWTFFSKGLGQATNSLVSGSNLIKKVYFPRLVMPLSAVVSGLPDFLLAFAILVVMMLVYGIVPTWNILWLPAFLLLALVVALGIGLWLSALNVQFRDIRNAVPFVIQTWLFVTPVAYPSNLIKDSLLRTLFHLNPMAGVVEGFRWALLNYDPPPFNLTLISVTVSVVILISGAFFFNRMEKTFADVV